MKNGFDVVIRRAEREPAPLALSRRGKSGGEAECQNHEEAAELEQKETSLEETALLRYQTVLPSCPE